SVEATAEPTATATPGLDGVAESGPTAEGARGETKAPATKQEAVRLALAARVRSPTQIARYVKDHFGMELTPAHASTIKGQLKREKKVKKRGANGRRKKRAPGSTDQAAQTPARARPAAQVAGLTPGDLTTLVEMARRAGGIERLVEYLEVLQRVR